MRVHMESYLGDVKITGQQAPVDVSSVANIRVVVLSCSLLQNLLNQALVAAWLLQEQFDDGSQYLELSLDMRSANMAPTSSNRGLPE